MAVRTYRSSFVLTPPKNVTFYVAIGLGLLGILLNYKVITIGALNPYSFLMVVAGLILLAVGCAFRGL